MTYPIVDLHCDLLSYLSGDPKRTPYEPPSRCAIPQLRQGGVCLQTLAVFTQTETDSSEKGMRQAQIYHELPLHYPHEFVHYTTQLGKEIQQIAILLAFENASGFCSEQEPLNSGLKRFKNIVQTMGKPLYVSLTWNTENRFGGGALTSIGLKEDGKRLLDELHQQQIAIDLSHASDHLANEIIDYMVEHQLNMPIMASHSNSRAVANVPRNLPNEIAREIFRRKGVIGLNLYRHFIGDTEEHLIKHISHWLELGGENHISFGADFFYDFDLPPSYRNVKELFFSEYQNASCYGKLLAFLKKELRLNDSILKKLAYENPLKFISSNGLVE